VVVLSRAVATLLLCLAVFSASVHAQETRYEFNVPAQPLGQVLNAITAQTGLRPFYTEDITRGVNSPGVQGSYTLQQALERVLEGTGLEYEFTGEKAVAIKLASSQEAAYQLPTISVSATRTAQPLDQVAASVSVVNREDFTARQAATVADVMKKLPNVDFGGGPRADGQLPTIRGEQNSNIILLVDGARRSSARVGDLFTPLYIDPYFLSRAEVVRGPASIYGSGGLGGAMVFTTISARDLLEDGTKFGVEAKAGYASGDSAQRYNARVYGRNGVMDWLIAGAHHKFNEIQQPHGGELEPNHGDDTSGLFKAGLLANEKLRFEVSHKRFDKTAWQTNNPQVDIGQVQWVDILQKESILSASLLDEDQEKTGDVRLFRTTTENQRDANTTYQIPGGTALPYPYTKNLMETNGVSAQNTTRMDSDFAGQHGLTYGLDIYQDKLTTLAGTTAAPNTPVSNPVNPDGKQKVQGVFLQDEIGAGLWRIVPSLRYDRYKATPGSSSLAANSDSHVSPKLAIAWDGLPGLSLFGSYGQAFRAPTLWEMYQNNPNPGFRRFAANPDLKPQTDTTFEFGAHFEKQQLLGSSDRLRLYGVIFQAKVEELIQSVTIAGIPGAFGSTLQYQNVAKATKKGLELSGDYQYGSWRVNLGASRIRIEDDVTGENLFSPPDKLTSQLSYAWPATDLTMTWAMTAVSAQDYDTTVLRQRKGYAVHDLIMTWRSPQQTYRVDFGITNALDKQYLSYQQTQAAALTAYEMGQSFNLSVSAAY